MTKLAIYPGSFDPPTRGHIDIIWQDEIFDRVIVAVATIHKKAYFLLQERLDMLQDCVVTMKASL